MIKANERYVQPMGQPWLCGRVPNGYWLERCHRVAYMRWLGRRLEYDAPEDWYGVRQRHFHDHRGGGLLNSVYSDSPLSALRDLMPEQDWKPWLFHRTPQRFWEDRANRRVYIEWLERKLGIERPDQWYEIIKEDFVRNSGHGLLANPICFRLLEHCARRAASRAACTAGSSRAIKIPMIAMTTSNSTSVKPLLRVTEHLQPERGYIGR